MLANEKRNCYYACTDQGRKRVLAIVTGVLVADLRNPGGLQRAGQVRGRSHLSFLRFSGRERIMRKIDGLFEK
jgi:hypothetical protein